MPRLDAMLAATDRARSRTHAHRLIENGLVRVNGKTILKPAFVVTDADVIDVEALDHYVSRAAHKLIAALDAFDIDVSGALCLDAGASTGGFTQVLLERGAARVVAVDVGHAQMSPSLRSDTRVRVIEGENVRDLTRERWRELSEGKELPRVIVADLSFISLGLVLPAFSEVSGKETDLVVLIKPQFEVGRGRTKEGVVTDPAQRFDAVTDVMWSAHDCGFVIAGLERSPVVGSHGNQEYLLWLKRANGSTPTEWRDRVVEVTR